MISDGVVGVGKVDVLNIKGYLINWLRYVVLMSRQHEEQRCE